MVGGHFLRGSTSGRTTRRRPENVSRIQGGAAHFNLEDGRASLDVLSQITALVTKVAKECRGGQLVGVSLTSRDSTENGIHNVPQGS